MNKKSSRSHSIHIQEAAVASMHMHKYKDCVFSEILKALLPKMFFFPAIQGISLSATTKVLFGCV